MEWSTGLRNPDVVPAACTNPPMTVFPELFRGVETPNWVPTSRANER